MKRGMDKATEMAVEKIKSMAVSVDSKEKLAQVAAISAGNDRHDNFCRDIVLSIFANRYNISAFGQIGDITAPILH